MPELNFDLVRTDPTNYQIDAYVILGVILAIAFITAPALVPDPYRHAPIVGGILGGIAGAMIGAFVSTFFFQGIADLQDLAGQPGNPASIILGLVAGAGGGAALGGSLGALLRI